MSIDDLPMTSHPAYAPHPDADRRAASAGQALELEPGKLWYLLAGDVVVYRAGRPIACWRAPAPLDLAGTVSGERRTTFVAASDVELAGLPLDHVDGSRLAAELAAESSRLWGQIEADAIRDDDTFLPSGAMPVPGPWWFRRAEALTFVVQGDPRRLARLLPRGLSPLPGSGGRYVVAVTRFEGVGSLDVRDTSRFDYHEVTPFVPVWAGRHGAAAYVPELYPDAWMAVILGREIHGFPKRTARVGFHEAGAELLLDRRLVLRARFGAREEAPPDDVLGEIVGALSGRTWAGRATTALLEHGPRFDLRMAVVVRKRVLSYRTAGRTVESDELVRVPFELDEIVRAERLRDVELELAEGCSVLHGSVVAGFRLETGFRFGGAGRIGRARDGRR